MKYLSMFYLMFLMGCSATTIMIGNAQQRCDNNGGYLGIFL